MKEQVPATKGQDVVEKLPRELVESIAVPVGATGVPLPVSETVTWQVAIWFADNWGGRQLIEIEEVLLPMAIDEVLLLPPWSASPPYDAVMSTDPWLPEEGV